MEEVLKSAFSRGYKKVVHIQYLLFILAQLIIDSIKRNVIYIHRLRDFLNTPVQYWYN